jgi:hypothetical protein
MRPLRILLVLLTASVLALAGGASAVGDPPKSSEEKDKFVLANDHVQVWFQGKKPTLRMLPADATSENATGAFTYRFTDLVEYRDLDGNGAISQGEVVATLDLDRADGYVVNRTATADGVVLNMSLASDVRVVKADLPKPPVPLPVDTQAIVNLVFTLRSEAQVVSLGPLNATVNATSIKYDLVVAKWPFVDAANDRLALETVVTGAVKDANATGIDQAAVTGTNGTALGALSWTTTAQGKTAAGAAIPVPVKTSITPEAEGASRIAYTYDAPGLGSLVHDPTIGLATGGVGAAATVGGLDAIKTVPGAGLLVAVGATGLAALAVRRR